MTAADTTGVTQPPALRRGRPRNQIARALRRRRRLRAGIVQSLYALVALALGLLIPEISIGFQLPGNRATEMLVAVGATTVTFIGVVFSLLFLVSQHGSTTFTPRLNLFRDAPIVWHAFALFTAVIVYSFTAAFKVGNREEVSGLVPIVAVALVLLSIAVYRALQLGAFKSIQLASTLAQVERRGRDTIDGLYTQAAEAAEQVSAGLPRDGDGHEVRWPRRAMVLQVIDVPRVIAAAVAAAACVEFAVGSGDMIQEGSPVARIHGSAGSQLDGAVLKSLTVGDERTFEQDPALALRVLEDIALRALSPAVNDPTTAVQALDRLDALLRSLVARDLQIGRLRSEDGEVRIVLQLPSWDDYVGIALDELLRSPQLPVTVSRRIEKLLRDLIAIAPPERQGELNARLRLVRPDA